MSSILTILSFSSNTTTKKHSPQPIRPSNTRIYSKKARKVSRTTGKSIVCSSYWKMKGDMQFRGGKKSKSSYEASQRPLQQRSIPCSTLD